MAVTPKADKEFMMAQPEPKWLVAREPAREPCVHVIPVSDIIGHDVDRGCECAPVLHYKKTDDGEIECWDHNPLDPNKTWER